MAWDLCASDLKEAFPEIYGEFYQSGYSECAARIWAGLEGEHKKGIEPLEPPKQGATGVAQLPAGGKRLTSGEVEAAFPCLVAEIREAGRAQAEADNSKGLFAIDYHIRAESKARKQLRDSLSRTSVGPGPAQAPASAPPLTKPLTFEALVEAEWRGSAALRVEFFDDFEIYSAYRRADNNGQVRIF